jgi:arylsulfatase A-like enzyme
VWSHDLWTQQALAVLAAQAARQAAAAAAGVAAVPFVLYLAYTDPHAGGWSGTAEQGNPVPSDGRFANETGWPANERDHASAIETFQDADVGAVVAALHAHGLRDNTLVGFASDNGASNEGGHDYAVFGSSGPLRGFKRCLTEGGIRTPLGISWPAVEAKGETNYPFAFWDVLPTLLDAAGVPAAAWPSGLDGVSVLPLLQGKAQPQHPPLYWEFCTAAKPPGVAGGKGWGQAVRNGTWKGVSFFAAEHRMRLYDLSKDEGETTDVAAAHPEIVAAFWVRLQLASRPALPFAPACTHYSDLTLSSRATH